MTTDELAAEIARQIAGMGKDAALAALNRVRAVLHDVSPMRAEPVDCVLWVRSDDVEANDYNPNKVAPPEMKLLRRSIEADGYTQPVVTWLREDGGREVVDGFHRTRVVKECTEVRERLMGYIPVTTVSQARHDRGDRMAATIRHNRARGVHQVQAMSEIVVELSRRNWTDAKIARELGMDQDEVLRLKQVSGLAELFLDHEFSEAWEAVGDAE